VLWGAPRIHDELLKLGFAVAQSTVAKYMASPDDRLSGQRWGTFLRNHLPQIWPRWVRTRIRQTWAHIGYKSHNGWEIWPGTSFLCESAPGLGKPGKGAPHGNKITCFAADA
jgi:hypothetical protein